MKVLRKGSYDKIDVCDVCEKTEERNRTLLWMHGPLGFQTTWAFHEDCLKEFMANLRSVLGLAPTTDE